MKLLSDSIDLDQRQKANYIQEKLLQLFPGPYGKMIALHLTPFLDMKIDSEKKEKAWLDIIAFLDEADFEYPPGFEEMFSGLPDDFFDRFKERMGDEMRKIATISKEEEKIYLEKIVEAFEKLNTEQVQEALSERFPMVQEWRNDLTQKGFYGVFLKNLSVLSEDYRKYRRFLKRLQKKLKAVYPSENFTI